VEKAKDELMSDMHKTANGIILYKSSTSRNKKFMDMFHLWRRKAVGLSILRNIKI